MSDTEQMRRQVLLDRLDSIQFDAERWQLEAWERGDVDEATRWFDFARTVRAAVLVAARP